MEYYRANSAIFIPSSEGVVMWKLHVQTPWIHPKATDWICSDCGRHCITYGEQPNRCICSPIKVIKIPKKMVLHHLSHNPSTGSMCGKHTDDGELTLRWQDVNCQECIKILIKGHEAVANSLKKKIPNKPIDKVKKKRKIDIDK